MRPRPATPNSTPAVNPYRLARIAVHRSHEPNADRPTPTTPIIDRGQEQADRIGARAETDGEVVDPAYITLVPVILAALVPSVPVVTGVPVLTSPWHRCGPQAWTLMLLPGNGFRSAQRSRRGRNGWNAPAGCAVAVARSK